MHRTIISWAVLLSSLLLTAVATLSVSHSVRERDEVRFENAAQATRDRIEARMETYIALLRGGTGFFAADDGVVTLEEFRLFTRRLDMRESYPGTQGIGFSLRFRVEQRDSLVNSLRAQGLEDFRIWPAGYEPERHAIVYLEPLDERNARALGFDMFSHPIRREAMTRAWELGEPAMSGPVRLVQEDDSGQSQRGFLIYAPVYRGGHVPATTEARIDLLLGFVYAPFRSDDLFSGIFGTEMNPRAAFQIYDGEITRESLLHDSRDGGIAPATDASFFSTTALEIAGRPWTLVFANTPYFNSGIQRSIAPLIAIGGLVISLILFILTRSQARAEMIVRESEQRLRTTFEALPVGVFVAEPTGEIGFSNTAIRRIWGAEDDADVPLHSTAKAWWPESGEPLKAQDWGLARALRGETVAEQTIELEALDGSRKTVLNRAFPVHNLAGNLEMAVAVIIDVTNQKRVEDALRERNREFSLMANSIPQLAWMADRNGSTFWFNERFYTYTGKRPDQVVSWGWASLVHPEHKDRVVQHLRGCLERGEEWEDTFPLRGRDEEYRWFLSRAVPLGDEAGTVIRWFGTNTDITEQLKAQEAEARLAREQAAREAAEAREEELRGLAAELERSNRELQDFAYVASHDLQEPLRKIATFSDLLRSDFGTVLDDQGRYLLDRMESAAHRMSRLIRDLLEFSRVSTRPELVETVDLNEVISDVLLDLEWRIRDSGGQVDVESLATLRADGTQLRQLFQNLIGNGLKFHRPNMPPVVRIHGEPENEAPAVGRGKDGQCFYRIVVEDNGIGFEQKYLDRIFTPFQRLHGRDQYEGTGMGLAISRRIVERHGGTITARSKPGKGSQFIVRLPLNSVSTSAHDVAEG